MPLPTELMETLEVAKQHLHDKYHSHVALHPIEEPFLAEAMEYALLNGGKRLRPLLIYLVGNMLDCDQSDLSTLALAVESIHAYSLVHDDLPAMDDDDLRRGQPTCHIKFDEATAILAGDALQCLAFEVLASAPLSDNANKYRIDIIKALSRAAGGSGMVAGQSIDLMSTNKDVELATLQKLHALKTGAILKACVELPYLICGKAETVEFEHILNFAHNIGMAFQIQDDILDVTSDTTTLGKPQGSDTDANKSTFVSLLGLQGAVQALHDNISDAKESLSALTNDTSKLELFCDYLVNREF